MLEQFVLLLCSRLTNRVKYIIVDIVELQDEIERDCRGQNPQVQLA